MNTIKIDDVKLEEVQDLQKIGRTTFSETFSATNSKNNMKKYLEKSLSKQQIENASKDAEKLLGRKLNNLNELYKSSI